MTPVTYVYAYFAKPYLGEKDSSNDFFFSFLFGTRVIENVPEMGGKCQRMVQFRMECPF